jgi:poly-gamma-glutamate synthesis protein (capsule biosynthesis protein)
MEKGLLTFRITSCFILSFILAACGADSVSFLPNFKLLTTYAPTRTPFLPVPWTAAPPTPVFPTNTPTITPPPYTMWVDPNLPKTLRQSVKLPPSFGRSEGAEIATLKIEVGTDDPVSQWIYALVAPFPTITDGVTSEDLHRAWQGQSRGPFAGEALLMSKSTRMVFTTLWGDPAEGAVEVKPPVEILDYAWDARPAWAIVRFEELHPRWKVLEIDGISPIHKAFDPQGYPLVLPIVITPVSGLVPEYADIQIPATNRSPDKLTTLVMTGVTALVRATAYTMEGHGLTYPGRDIRNWLLEADLTHISNEVPFAKDCPFPNPVQPDMLFCSDARYIVLLEDVGSDIIELTGDHFSDWGSEAMLYTLELYDERDWKYYGGGANLPEGRKAVTVEHNGNKLAFIGCNAKGGGFAQASQTNPGAAACDFTWMRAEIERLRGENYLPIATFQHFEYYTYYAQANQKRDADVLIEAGAVIVSGSQAHQPQGLEVSDGGFIHHGLGNLFFDQLDVSEDTRKAFIDRHVFYDGRHISTELLTILFVDYARPRPMTIEERETLLETTFSASGW